MSSRKGVDASSFLLQILQAVIDVLESSLMLADLCLLLGWKISWDSRQSQAREWPGNSHRRSWWGRGWNSALISAPARASLIRGVGIRCFAVVVSGDDSPPGSSFSGHSTLSRLRRRGRSTSSSLSKGQISFSGVLPTRPVQNLLPEAWISSVFLSKGGGFLGRTHEPVLHDNMLSSNSGDQLGRFFTSLTHLLSTNLSVWKGSQSEARR